MAKLTNEQKIEIYERRLKGETLPSLALKFNVNIHNIKYLIRLLNKHGYSILRNDKNKYYSKEFKEIAINRVLIKKESLRFVAVELGLSSIGILHNWIKKYKENCYNVIENKKEKNQWNQEEWLFEKIKNKQNKTKQTNKKKPLTGIIKEKKDKDST